MLSVALLLMTAAVPQDAGGSAESVDQLVACRSNDKPAERLACFDRVADRIKAARRSGEMIVLDRAKVIERKRSRFGLVTGPSEMFGGGSADTTTEVRELNATVAAVKPAAAYGRYDLQLTNGMIWQTVDTLEYAPRVGAAVTVKKTAFGGYRLQTAGDKSVLAKRLR